MGGEEDQKKGKLRLPTGGVSTIPENLFDLPQDRYMDVLDEIETDLHMSRRAVTNEVKVSHVMSFLFAGLALLPKKEEKYVAQVREDLVKMRTFPLPDTRPGMDTNKQSIYEISIDIGTGFTTRCLAPDMSLIRASLIELKYLEILQSLLPYRDDLVRKMIAHNLLEQREEYGGGFIRDELGLSETLDEILEEGDEE